MDKKINDVYDNQSESGVIATLIAHPEFIGHSDYLKPAMFRNKENGCIYWAIDELYKKGIEKIDGFNLETMINSNQGIKNIIERFDKNFIEQLIDLSYLVARSSVEEYKVVVNKVVELSFKRELFNRLENVQSLCFKDSVGLGEIQKSMNDNVDGLVYDYIIGEDIDLLGDNLDNIWEDICSRRTDNGFGFPSKFPILNNYFSYEKTELVLVSGKLKAGKSVFMMEEALHKAKNGIMTAVLDTEMSTRMNTERILSNISGIELTKIKSGNYTLSEEILINDAKNLIKRLPFVHIYRPVWELNDIYTVTKLLINKFGLEFLVFDYLKYDGEDSYSILGKMTNFLKNDIAGGLNLAVLAGAQLNRTGDIADSIKIDRYTSCRLAWAEKTLEEITDDGIPNSNYKLSIPVNRIGMRTGEDEHLSFKFDPKYMRIHETKQKDDFEL